MNRTDNRRRHLAVLLAQVEDAVEDLERLVTDPGAERALRVERKDLPDDRNLARLRRAGAGIAYRNSIRRWSSP